MRFIDECLKDIKDRGLYREFKFLSGPQSKYTLIGNKRVLLMTSNNYLDLCNDVRLKDAAEAAIRTYGVGAGGSRLTTGSYELHDQLEKKIADFKNTEAAILFNTGYMANIGVVTAIADKEWILFSDALNHASIIDGCRLSGAKIVVYKHCDMEDLRKKIKAYEGKKRCIVTDGVFSMDGDIAPLDKIVELAKANNLLTVVDDAHGTGVLGNRGTGCVEYFNLKGQVDIQIGTLSKALASEGGFVAGSKSLVTYLRHKARSFIYSTALSPATIAVSLCSLDIVKSEKDRRDRLLENTKWFQEELKKLGFHVLESNTAIIPLIIGSAEKATKLSEKLFEKDIFISAIRPPTVPDHTSRLRITLMATHSREELKYVLNGLKEAGMELGMI
ncbi:8-amino-7-oxononanoate synthase [Clostridium formicaceticum]|uniref:8-amino-7-ketopelargonate synthase n=1 Tax=Clostridium formicaceticum TaxID=1497 RepID=A0AAC9RMC8_9CLOT|nr:8-amino-7-oxononanoate synthase [Clostridium formicaceticum]AOY76533.1 8-amino-7-oxononanoate synthase [Clostridium formicaceticum]ARE86945.1 8-amino-7-oxononanoate synthase [Clostridium formicaceticum]